MNEYIPFVIDEIDNKNNEIGVLPTCDKHTSDVRDTRQSTIRTIRTIRNPYQGSTEPACFLGEAKKAPNRPNRPNLSINISKHRDLRLGTPILIGPNPVLIDEQEPPPVATSPWLAYQWPKVEGEPLSFSRKEQPAGKGSLMEVYAPWGTLLSGGPVLVLDVRDDGLGREYLWYDQREERQRWHTGSLCRGRGTLEEAMR